MIRHPSSDAQQVTVIKRRLSGRRNRGAGIADVWDSAKDPATGVSSHSFSYGEWAFTAMAVNRAVSSHLDRVG